MVKTPSVFFSPKVPGKKTANAGILQQKRSTSVNFLMIEVYGAPVV